MIRELTTAYGYMKVMEYSALITSIMLMTVYISIHMVLGIPVLEWLGNSIGLLLAYGMFILSSYLYLFVVLSDVILSRIMKKELNQFSLYYQYKTAMLLDSNEVKNTYPIEGLSFWIDIVYLLKQKYNTNVNTVWVLFALLSIPVFGFVFTTTPSLVLFVVLFFSALIIDMLRRWRP